MDAEKWTSRALFVLAALAYALALELLQHVVITYTYRDLGPEFDGVPLVIPLVWVGAWSVARATGERLGQGWIAAVAIGALTTTFLVVPVELAGVAAGRWSWAEQTAIAGVPWLVPLLAFSASFTFLLGYTLVARMNVPGLRARSLLLIVTLAPLLFVHLEFLYVMRTVLRCLLAHRILLILA
jgi:hypothetical protein